MFIVDDIIIFIVAIALSIALAPKPPRPKAATISDFELPTAEEGRPVPVVFGQVDITGPNVLWYGALGTDPIRKHSLFSSSTVGFKYYLGFHLGLCHGPVDAITRVTWADKTAWTGNITATGTAGINRPNLFGGESREGGVNGAFDIVMGTASEAINGYLTGVLGQVPAYRGITSFIWKTGMQGAPYTQDDGSIVTSTNKSGYVGVTPYMKPIAIRVRRILQGWANGTWYAAKAVINSSSAFSGAPTWTSSFSSKVNGAISSTSGTSVGYLTSDTNINADTLGFILVDSEWMQITSVNPTTGVMTVVRHVFGTTGATHADGAPFQFWAADTSVTPCMNAAHIIYQCLTDPKWGNGIPTSSLNDAAFRAAADTFFTEGMGLCMIWVQAATVGDFINIVLQHCNASLVFDPVAGLYSLIPIRGGYDVSLLPVYNESNIASLEDCQVPGFADQPNQVTITYTDPATGKSTSITGQNLASVDIQGKVVPVGVDLSGIRSHQLAFDTLGRELSSRTTPLVRVKIKINRSAWKMTTAGLFKFSWADRGLSNVVMRALSIDRGTLQSNMITIDAVQDIFSLGLANYVLATNPSPSVGAPSTSNSNTDTSAGTVISTTRTSPPSAPTDLDSYIVPSGATGAWSGHSGQMARWDALAGIWVFIGIPSGVPIYDQSTGTYVTSSGGTVINTGIGGSSTATQVAFDDSTSHLGAVNVQQAIDAIAASMGSAINPRAYANGLWYADTFDGTLFDSPDGINFSQHNSVSQTSFTNLIYRADTDRYYATKGATIGRSSTNNIYGAWTYVTVGTTTWAGMRFVPELGAMYVWHDNVIRVSTDSAVTWTDPNVAVSSYRTEVLADTPILFARLGDDTTIDKDSASGSTNAMLVGVGVLGSGYSPVTGIVTDTNPLALAFTNTAYVESRTSANGVTDLLTDTGAFTIELWIKQFGTPPSIGTILFSKNRLIPGVVGSAGQTVTLSYGTDSKVQFQTATPDVTTQFPTVGMNFKSSVVSLFDGLAHHIVATRDGSGGAVIYVDGVNVGSVSGATVDHIIGGTAAAGDIWANNFNHNAASGNMILDELALYNTSLSSTRVGVHYDRGSRGIVGAFSIVDLLYDAPNSRHLVFGNLAIPNGVSTIHKPQALVSTNSLQTLGLLSSLSVTPTTDDASIAMVAKKPETAGIPSPHQQLGQIWGAAPGATTIASVVYAVVPNGTITYKFFRTGGNCVGKYYNTASGLELGTIPTQFGIPTVWDNIGKIWVSGTSLFLTYLTNTGNYWSVQRLNMAINKWEDQKQVTPAACQVGTDVFVGITTGNSLGQSILQGSNISSGTVTNVNAPGSFSIPGTWTAGYSFQSNGPVAASASYYYDTAITTTSGITENGIAWWPTSGATITTVFSAPTNTQFIDLLCLGSYLYAVTKNNTTGLLKLVRYLESTKVLDAGFTPPTIRTPPNTLLTVQQCLYLESTFMSVCGIYGFVVNLTTESSPVYYQGPEYAVVIRKADGITTVLATSLTYGSSWTFPSNSYPSSSPGHAADSIVWDGVRYVITGLGWSGTSPTASSVSFTFSSGGAIPPAYYLPLLLPNGAGTTLAQASAIGKGTQGGLVSSDGLTWTLGPKVKAQASQVSYNSSTGTVLPVIDVQSGLTLVSGAWGILQEKIFGD